MDFYESKVFGKVSLPSSLSEILNLISVHADDRRNVYLWRGQSNIDWQIHSSAYRRLSKDSKTPTEKDMQRYEKRLLKQATHQGYRFEKGKTLSDFELLAKLQHHGAATRLIDCSRNILVALWFACSARKDDYGLLFGMHTDHVGGEENDPEERPYNNIFEGLEKLNHPQIWQPPVVSKRIAAQGAQFLYSTVSNNKLGSLSLDVEDHEVYLAIGVTPQVKLELVELLNDTFDVRQLTLFPDIDGFGFAHSFNFHKYEHERW